MPTRTTQRPPEAAKADRRLSRYYAKRDLTESGEPGGETSRARGTRAIRSYVIQKHDATRLHYDFRLEMNGVLRSWAVPKGVPMKAGERVLAVEVEDHPLQYGKFEGTIPEGNYGAGTVMLWDRGSYTVAEGSPEAAYREGKIHLALAGEKCVGEWTLVRMRGRPGDKATNWLLIKKSSPAHRATRTGAAREISVVSGRTMEEIAGKPAKAAARPRAGESLAGVRQGRPPSPRTTKKKAPRRPLAAAGRQPSAARPSEHARAEFIPPMKAVSVDALPKGEWRLEIKLDGYRAVAVINADRVELWSRNRKQLTADYPEVIEALQKFPCRNAVIDGEIVALDPQGRSRFQLLQGRSLPGTRPPIVYYAFDLLQLDGGSLLALPIEERQKALKSFLGDKISGTIRLSPVFEMEPETLLEAVRQQGLEGIIAKAAGSIYQPDQRSNTWLKLKVHGEQEFVIGGYTAPRKSRTHFGAILVGYYEGKNLIYAGKVGTGFDQVLLESLHAEFQRHELSASPFANLPMSRKSRFGTGMTASAMRDVTWVKPELVAQIRFAEWTDDGLLRQPVFLGLRRDKKPREVVREAAPVAEQGG